MTTDQILSAAWTSLAPGRDQNLPFPRGFWPDVARLAVEIAMTGVIPAEISWRPTMCTHGNYPEPTRTSRQKSGGKISAADRAANTAKLLASLRSQP